jgi:hypothetical protein
MALLGLQPSDRAEFATPRVEVCRHTPIVRRTEGLSFAKTLSGLYFQSFLQAASRS